MKIMKRTRLGKGPDDQEHNREQKREDAVSCYPECNQLRKFFTGAFVHERPRHQQIPSALCKQSRDNEDDYQQQR